MPQFTGGEPEQPPPPETQKDIIKELFSRNPMKEGDMWYLISEKCILGFVPAENVLFQFNIALTTVRYYAWKSYVGYDRSTLDEDAKPGPIDNSCLLNQNELKPDLKETIQYELVPKPVWEQLAKWYGGGPEIMRHVVGIGSSRMVEIYPLQLQFLSRYHPLSPIRLQVSRTATVKEVKKKVAAELSRHPQDPLHTIDADNIRLFRYFAGAPQEEFDKDEMPIDYYVVNPSHKIWVDINEGTSSASTGSSARVGASGGDQENVTANGQLSTGFISSLSKDYQMPASASSASYATPAFPAISASAPTPSPSPSSITSYSSPTTSTYYTSPSTTTTTSSSYYNYEYRREGSKKGCAARGLMNLGNTCFMNSAIQCLSHTPPLIDYFLSGRYKSEINYTNPLGMKGMIAVEYGSLLQKLWSGEDRVIVPRDMKYVIAKFAPQFSGFAQHDSQELLAFLLDGLHEDLNRVQNKPYVESIESDGRPDAEVAAESWNRHLMRNKSIIVDLFQGQFKSTLICPKCSHISITFDPFMYLSLPLPVKTERTFTLTFFYQDSRRKLLTITIPKLLRVSAVKEKIAEQAGVAADYIILCEIHDHKFYRIFQDQENLSQMRDNELLAAYEVVPPPDVPAPELVTMPVYHRIRTVRGDVEFVANPTIILVRRNATAREIYDAIWQRSKDFLPGAASPSPPPPPAIGAEPMEIDSPNFFRPSSSPYASPYSPPPSPAPDSPSNQCSSQRHFFIRTSRSYRDYSQFRTLEDNDIPCRIVTDGIIIVYWECVFDQEYAQTLDNHIYRRWNRAATETIPSIVSGRSMREENDKGVTLAECLRMFVTPEKLSKDDPWYCSKCKDFQEATKQMELWKLPRVLVVHLKRFSFTNRSRDKITTLVDFPLEGLDLTEYNLSKEGSAIYDLFAVSNHYGGLGGGHYTAYCKLDGKWYDFDDSSVTAIPAERVRSSAAYVLFYLRRDADESGTKADSMQEDVKSE